MPSGDTGLASLLLSERLKASILKIEAPLSRAGGRAPPVPPGYGGAHVCIQFFKVGNFQ